MKRAITKLVIMAAITAIVLSIPSARNGAVALPVVHAQEGDGGCSLASLTGRYALDGQGTVVAQLPGFPAPPLPFGEVALETYDGAGKFFGRATANADGVLLPKLEVTGTYTVNRACTGSKTVNITSLGLTVQEAIIVIGGGRRF